MRCGHVIAGLVCALLLHEGTGCSEWGCTEAACTSGYNVEFIADSVWAQGDYRFRVELDDYVVTCEGSLPLDPSCETTSISCEDPRELVFFGEVGCLLSPEEQSFAGFWVNSTDITQVTVKVWHAEESLVDVVLTPKFAVERPNGEGCGPVCTMASDDVVF